VEPFIIIEPFGLVAQNPDLFTEQERKEILLGGWADQDKMFGIAREDTTRND
jgi:hypothetical protein